MWERNLPPPPHVRTAASIIAAINNYFILFLGTRNDTRGEGVVRAVVQVRAKVNRPLLVN